MYLTHYGAPDHPGAGKLLPATKRVVAKEGNHLAWLAWLMADLSSVYVGGPLSEASIYSVYFIKCQMHDAW